MILIKKHKIYVISPLYLTLLFMAFIWSSNGHSAAREQFNIGLHVTPERCVALRQGQTCYQEVTFNWR